MNKEEKIGVILKKGEEDMTKMEQCVSFILSMRGQIIMENRLPEMWQEPSNIKDMKYILRNFGIAKAVTDAKNQDTRYFVKKNGEIIATYDDAIYNGVLSVEVAKNMHSVDTSNYYVATVEVTFSPVLLEGGSKEPTEIVIWSSDSVSTEDEFDFEGA